MREQYIDNDSNVSENNDIDIDNDNVMRGSSIHLTDHQISLYEEFLAGNYRTYSNLGFLNLACAKLQDFMYRWHNELNEDERKYLAVRLKYKEYLASPYWHLVSLIYKCRVNFRCERCGQERRSRLSLHHKTYDHIGSELQYPEDMEVLCSACHMEEHGIMGGNNA